VLVSLQSADPAAAGTLAGLTRRRLRPHREDVAPRGAHHGAAGSSGAASFGDRAGPRHRSFGTRQSSTPTPVSGSLHGLRRHRARKTAPLPLSSLLLDPAVRGVRSPAGPGPDRAGHGRGPAGSGGLALDAAGRSPMRPEAVSTSPMASGRPSRYRRTKVTFGIKQGSTVASLPLISAIYGVEIKGID
jgi:hypothetical protein